MKLKYTLLKSVFVIALYVCSMNVRVEAQCTPAIPSTVFVRSVSSSHNGGPNFVWICTGIYDSTNSIGSTYYVEPGGTLYGKNGINNTAYVPKGAKLVYNGSANSNTVYFVDSADVVFGSAGNGTKIQCSDIIFDYSNAPSNGCAQLTGIKNREQSRGVVIYPNPAKSTLTVHYEASPIRQVSIYNILGSLVYSREVFQNSKNETFIDVSNLDAGLYIVKVNTAEGIRMGKISKE